MKVLVINEGTYECKVNGAVVKPGKSRELYTSNALANVTSVSGEWRLYPSIVVMYNKLCRGAYRTRRKERYAERRVLRAVEESTRVWRNVTMSFGTATGSTVPPAPPPIVAIDLTTGEQARLPLTTFAVDAADVVRPFRIPS